MKIYQKIASILIIFSILIVCISSFVCASNDSKLDELRKNYPTGMQWNSDYHGSTQCHGFAGLMYDSYYGKNPYGNAEKTTNIEQIQPGDIVRYNGHTVWILTRSGESTTVAECNYDWQNHVRWDQYKSMNELRNNFEYVYKAPYVLGTTPPTEANLPTPTNVNADTSSGVQINWDKKSYCYGYKIKIYDSSNQIVKEIDVKQPATTYVKVFGLKTGTYTARVYCVGVNDSLSKGYGTVSFSCKTEAEYVQIATKSPTQISIGESFKYIVYIYPTDGMADIKFFAGAQTDTSIVNIEEDGTITGLKLGTTKVYFQFKTSRTTFSNSYEVTVIPRLKMSTTAVKMNVRETLNIPLSSKIPNQEVFWTSNNTDVATVDNEGNVTAVGKGTATIVARQNVRPYGNDVSYPMDHCTITVTAPIPIKDIKLNKQELSLVKGKSETLTVNINPLDTTDDKTITWSSSNPSVAKVEQNGKITGVGNGFADITAKCGEFTSTCKVEVREAFFVNKIFSINEVGPFLCINPIPAELDNGKSVEVKWTSNNPSVVYVPESMPTSYYGKRGGFATLTGFDERYGTVTYIIYTKGSKLKLSDGKKQFQGDLNNNSRFDEEDYIKLRQLLQKGQLTEDEMKIADINGDKIVDERDYELLKKIVDEKLIDIDLRIPLEGVSVTSETIEYEPGSLMWIIPVSDIYPYNTTDDVVCTWSIEDPEIATVSSDGAVLMPKKVGKTYMIVTTNIKDENGNYITGRAELIVKLKKIKGDVNGDGKVTAMDYTKILAHVKKKKLLTDEEFERADVNGDGKVTAIDYTKVLAAVKNKITL